MVFTISNQRVEIVKEEKPSVWLEFFVSFVVSIPFFTYGIESTCLSASPHAGHFIRSAGVPISTSVLVVMSILAAPVFCWCIDRYGRKLGVFAITLVQGASLIPLFVESPHSSMALHAIAGVAAGGLFTVLPTYQAELTSIHTRGVCTVLLMLMTTLGHATKLLMALEERMFLMTALVMLQIILMSCVHESPNYLMHRGKHERSKETLSKLKRLSEDSPSLNKILAVLRAESETAKARGKLTLRSFYRNKIWWDAFKIGLLLYTTNILCGSVVFLDQHKALQQLDLAFDPQSKLVLTALLAGSAISLVCVTFLDRKYLLTVGYLLMCVSSGVLAVYTQVDLTVATLRWVPLVALATLVLGFGMSWALHVVILADLFSTQLRATILGILFTYSQLIRLAHVHSFQYLEEHVGIFTLFYIFAGVNLYGGVYTLFAVPLTRNRSLKQIEKQLKRTPLPA